MKKIVLGLMMLQATVMMAEKPNAADYPIKVDVVSSASLLGGSGTNAYTYQVIEAMIDGQPIQLRSGSAGVLALGNYQAKISPSIHGPKNANTYDIYRGYDFLMPDGHVRTFIVTRLGPAVGTNP